MFTQNYCKVDYVLRLFIYAFVLLRREICYAFCSDPRVSCEIWTLMFYAKLYVLVRCGGRARTCDDFQQVPRSKIYCPVPHKEYLVCIFHSCAFYRMQDIHISCLVFDSLLLLYLLLLLSQRKRVCP